MVAQPRRAKMPNWCSNNIVVTGSVEDIAHFTWTCVRLDEKGKARFDFNSLIPMPPILEDTTVGGPTDDALAVLGRDDLAWIPRPLEERMKYWNVPDIEALKGKIGLEALQKARQSIEAFEQTGTPNWYVWANMNWGTKWNASEFEVIREEPGRYECRFETAWCPPEPVYVKLAEMFPKLCFEINGRDDQLPFDFEATYVMASLASGMTIPTEKDSGWESILIACWITRKHMVMIQSVSFV
jgi:hypothetical protein